MSAALLAMLPWRPALVSGADFDGTNDYMLRGGALTSVSDSKLGIFSAWVRVDAGDGVSRHIFSSDSGANTSPKFDIELNTSNRFSFFGTRASSDSGTLLLASNSTYAAGATWLHVLFSFDMSDTGKRHLYINGVEDMGTVTTYADVALGFSQATEWGVGIRAESVTLPWNGALAELYFAPGQYLDFSVESNRTKFRTLAGAPANLGSDGSTPTGVAPSVYQRVVKGAAVTTFATNLGGGGNFSITGTLEIASSSPSG